ncbi:MAG: sensor domain-containing diguanylate cyclase [Candidatus Nitrohelix vancouverensis]|uniref:diguanylate cyclase n=1 Tax=Candidatus Nitrohelix vancouverensis TaxID=2705534 RepID=A0A7T0C2A4_9BACT|nr:MAG: sensor domain-containing diguanylate cyclase [Candidatus Nitrohelix vancouverensis]
MNPNDKEHLKHSELIMVRSLLKRQNSMLGKSMEHLDRLIYLQKSMSLLSCDEINRVLISKLPYILSVNYFSLFLYDKSRRYLQTECHNHPGMDKMVQIHYSESEIMRDAITSGSYVLEHDFLKCKYFTGKTNPLFKSPFFVSIPLMIENEIIGALNLNDSENDFFNVNDLDFALNISEFIALSLSNAKLYEKTQIDAVTDGLTGLTNRQQMAVLLDKEMERCLRYSSTLSVIMLDVDYFKKVNDTYGHQVGDDVLMVLSDMLKRVCRSNDVAARYGGEEFLMALPETPEKGALQIAERIRSEMERYEFQAGELKFQVTISCGVASFDSKDLNSVDALIKVADSALYRAKESGRNRIVLGNAGEDLGSA